MVEAAITRLAAFVAGLDYDEVPGPMIEKAKRHSLDTFGAALAGATSQEARLVAAALEIGGENGDAPLWGTRTTLAPRAAALVNGVAAHAFELDDTGGCDHSGAVVLPAILAALPLLERKPCGRDLLTAVVVGYDVGRRVMEAAGGYVAHNGAGWHSTGTCGVFAATAGCASLLRLSAAQTADALGVAASLASGVWAFIHDGAMTKRLHAGRAAEGGLTAALLARRGFAGPRRIFDDAWGGFFSAYARGDASPERLTQALGSDWMLRHAAIKPYASCRDTHAAVDAVGRVIAREGLGADDVAAVRARLNGFLAGMVGGRDVSTLPAAQMSLPYAVAARLCFGSADLAAYGEARRRAPEIVAMLERIAIVRDDSVTASWDSSLIVETHDGRRFEEPTSKPLGAPENPLPFRDLREKFEGLARLVLPASRIAELIDVVMSLESRADVSDLPRRLAAA